VAREDLPAVRTANPDIGQQKREDSCFRLRRGERWGFRPAPDAAHNRRIAVLTHVYDADLAVRPPKAHRIPEVELAVNHHRVISPCPGADQGEIGMEQGAWCTSNARSEATLRREYPRQLQRTVMCAAKQIAKCPAPRGSTGINVPSNQAGRLPTNDKSSIANRAGSSQWTWWPAPA